MYIIIIKNIISLKINIIVTFILNILNQITINAVT